MTDSTRYEVEQIRQKLKRKELANWHLSQTLPSVLFVWRYMMEAECQEEQAGELEALHAVYFHDGSEDSEPLFTEVGNAEFDFLIVPNDDSGGIYILRGPFYCYLSLFKRSVCD
jgi:hypothetical protein